MKRVRRFLLAALLILFDGGRSAHAFYLHIEGLDEGVRQGDVALLRVRPSVTVDTLSGEFAGKTLFFESDGTGGYTALVGIGSETEKGIGEISLAASTEMESVSFTLYFEVLKRDFKVERLKLPKRMVTPEEIDLERIEREREEIRRVRETASPLRFWAGDFVSPAEGKASDNFGARRIMNGEKKAPHSGTDIKAFSGTAVRSPGAGLVAYLGDTYYGGNTVIIDHGQGLTTLYMHLSRIDVSSGAIVEKGEVIGLVGSTGRSTGPHLHWGAALNGEWIDPLALLSLEIDPKREETAGAEHPPEPLGGN